MKGTRHTLDILEMLVELGWWDGRHSFESEVGAHSLARAHSLFPSHQVSGGLSCLFV